MAYLKERVVPDGKESDATESESNSYEKEQLKDDLIIRLRAELTIQSKINTDLKKLLVASVGDDIESRVETLIRTKAVLSHDITDYTKRISTDSEMLDQLTIQADMWRSKFLANKLTIEKIDLDCRNFKFLWNRIHVLILGVFTELRTLHSTEMMTHRNLKFLRDSLLVDKIDISTLNESTNNNLELSDLNLKLSSSIKNQLLGNCQGINSVLDANCFNKLMPHEADLFKILNEDNLLNSIQPKVQSIMCDRFCVNANYENITLNCCKKCTSDIYVV